LCPSRKRKHPGRLQAELMSRGLRMSWQRRTILSVVETAQQHLDATQILRRARELDPEVDRVNVYRTLNLLKGHGLVDELDLMHIEGESTITSAIRCGVTFTWPVCAAARSPSLRATCLIV
jgi:Fe2+ or Zn2+ uptake regulation protein